MLGFLVQSRFVRLTFIAVELAVLIFLWANLNIKVVGGHYVTANCDELPSVHVAVIPGTTRYLQNGGSNLYFSYRINAAVELYQKGKIQHILVSGDNSQENYNEPADMLAALVEKGIPRSSITLDYAGFDTYDSMIRAKEVFGQQKFVVITQEFQNERAVYIARKFDIEAYGYNCKDVQKYNGFFTKLRDSFARVKAYFEVMFGVKPTFLGKKETLTGS